MANQEERRLILEMIANQKITAEEGLSLLQSLPPAEEEEFDEDDQLASLQDSQAEPITLPFPSDSGGLPPGADRTESSEQGLPGVQSQPASGQTTSSKPEFSRWRRFWMIPLWIGAGITVASALLMVWAQRASGLGFWFFCAGAPFTLGVILIALAWQTRTSPWLHLRVHQKPGEYPQNIAISLPLPLGISSWFLRTFRHRIPGMEGVSIDEVITTLHQSTSPDNPIFIEVEEEDGEQVQIYIG